MQRFAELPPLPEVEVHVEEDRSDGSRGFLWRRSRVIRIRAGAADFGSLVYDEVDRAALDAVIVVPYFRAPSAAGSGVETWVVLRSAVRPPITLRDSARSPLAELGGEGLWEVPAGLIEEDEMSAAGIRRAAQRELFEETGFSVDPEAFRQLGPATYPAPALVAERHYFFSVEVDPAQQQEPALDGSALEAAGVVIAVPLAVLFEAIWAGRIGDAKTELGLRRLADQLGRAHA